MPKNVTNIGKAMAICQDINSSRFTDTEKATAIYLVMNMPTHMHITKDKMLELIKWLWHYNFEWEEK